MLITWAWERIPDLVEKWHLFKFIAFPFMKTGLGFLKNNHKSFVYHMLAAELASLCCLIYCSVVLKKVTWCWQSHLEMRKSSTLARDFGFDAQSSTMKDCKWATLIRDLGLNAMKRCGVAWQNNLKMRRANYRLSRALSCSHCTLFPDVERVSMSLSGTPQAVSDSNAPILKECKFLDSSDSQWPLSF